MLQSQRRIPADELWDLGSRLKKLESKSAARYLIRAVTEFPHSNSLNGSIAIRQARALWLLDNKDAQKTEQENATLRSLMEGQILESKRIVTDSLPTNEAQKIDDVMSALNFVAVDFETSVESDQFRISISYSPYTDAHVRTGFGWHYKDRDLDSWRHDITKRGFNMVKRTIENIEGEERVSELWHQTDSTRKELENQSKRNSQFWEKVKVPTFQPTDEELIEFTDACKKFPQGIFYNTLGVALYRSKNYEGAIEALQVSIVESPTEFKHGLVHPADYAFLALSYKNLGDSINAEQYCAKFDQAMKAELFANDKELLEIGKELKLQFANTKN